MNEFTFDKKTDSLFQAILSLRDKSEAEKFFRDLCTSEEIRLMAERWEIARLLGKKESYRNISEKLGVSTTTVSRVATWLYNGEGGYRLALNRTKDHHHNLSEKRL